MQSIFLFVQSTAWRPGRFGDWSADVAQTLANHVCAQQIAFLGRKFLRMLFLQMGWLCQDEQFVDQGPIHARKETHIDA